MLTAEQQQILQLIVQLCGSMKNLLGPKPASESLLDVSQQPYEAYVGT